ncbi:MAG: hypothetical protein JWQ25_384, partial [Daejeonella sp.]|nr:hypothetical protein [Daejeonella sp.]
MGNTVKYDEGEIAFMGLHTSKIIDIVTYSNRKFRFFKNAGIRCFLALFLLISLQLATAWAQDGRTVISINQGWSFTKGKYNFSANPSVIWEKVSIPHTWNALDVTDDESDYHRGTCWYKKNLSIDKSLKGKNLFLFFEGVNQHAEVYINGKKAGSHIGGYTRFSVQIDQFIDFAEGSQNTVVVKVDNSFNENLPPLTADFTFFGGIYRDVYLIVNNPVHFNLKNGAAGVFITTPLVNTKEAAVSIKSEIVNSSGFKKMLIVHTVIKSREGKIIAEKQSNVSLKPGEEQVIYQLINKIGSPELWTPENPYLYTVVTQIKDAKTGLLVDELINPLGFRWFRFDAAKGFFLNDKPYKLIGTSRHQDFKGLGNALTDVYHTNDVNLLKEMGANFLRVAHYPQDPAVLEACDRLGILAAVEIPVVNAITESEEFYQNCKFMQVEMIRQNFNHPSVIIWGYMNEVLLRPKFSGQPERQKEYFAHITQLAEQLDALTRKEDPSRYTMMAHHGDFNRYKQTRLIDIPMLVGWNLYQGWYSGSVQGFGEFLDRYHQEFPDKPVMVTEYGADADPRIRSLNPERFDK